MLLESLFKEEYRPHGKESTEVRITQNKRKWELLLKIEEITMSRHTNTHTRKQNQNISTDMAIFLNHIHLLSSDWERRQWVRQNISILFPCACPPWSLQFLVLSSHVIEVWPRYTYTRILAKVVAVTRQKWLKWGSGEKTVWEGSGLCC